MRQKISLDFLDNHKKHDARKSGVILVGKYNIDKLAWHTEVLLLRTNPLVEIAHYASAELLGKHTLGLAPAHGPSHHPARTSGVFAAMDTVKGYFSQGRADAQTGRTVYSALLTALHELPAVLFHGFLNKTRCFETHYSSA